jgi:hypothetical protein
MAASNIESELQAVKAITSQLTALDEEARERVLDYVFKFLGLPATLSTSASKRELETIASMVETTASSTSTVTPRVRDIRSLKEGKAPRTANEMAAIVAYYLSELAPADERKETISTTDIQKYFKQAGYPLPKVPRFTLPNAAAAGYFDSIAHGQYRLNPVGYNLVAHSLPAITGPSPTKAKRKITNKKSRKNSSPAKTDSKKKSER